MTVCPYRCSGRRKAGAPDVSRLASRKRQYAASDRAALQRLLVPRLTYARVVEPPRLVVVRRDGSWHDGVRAWRRDLDGWPGYARGTIMLPGFG